MGVDRGKPTQTWGEHVKSTQKDPGPGIEPHSKKQYAAPLADMSPIILLSFRFYVYVKNCWGYRGCMSTTFSIVYFPIGDGVGGNSLFTAASTL